MKILSQVITRKTLENGVRFVHVQTPLPVSTVSVWFPFGSRQDPSGEEGMAHLLEHLCMKSTPAHPSPQEMAAFRSSQGMSYNAITTAETMRFVFEAASEDTHAVLAHAVESLLTFTISPADFVAEKRVINDERARKKQQPERMMGEWVREALFPNSGIDHSGLGSRESVDSITFEHLQKFLLAHITNAVKTFVVCSPHDAEQFEPMLATSMLGSVGSMVRSRAPFAVHPIPETRKPLAAPNTRVGIGFATRPYGDGREVAALRLLAASYLCGNHSARLVLRLRGERAMTYGVQGETQVYTDAGSMGLHFSVPEDRVAEALRICEQEIALLRDGHVDPALLDASKKMVRLQALRQGLSAETIVAWYGIREMYGEREETMASCLANIEQLRAEDLQAVALQYLLPERRSVVLHGGGDA